MVDVIKEGNKYTYHEVLGFFQSIRQKMSQQRILESNSGGEFNIQNNNIIMEIRNPVLRRSKGQPKSKRTISILEENNTKAYKCKLCKQVGHNSKTCKEKENSRS